MHNTLTFTKTAPRLLAATALTSCLVVTSAATARADEALADLVQEVAPAVVTIMATQDAAPITNGIEQFNLPEGSPFGDFFRQFGPQFGPKFGPGAGPNDAPSHRQGQGQRQRGLGSGFIVDADGLIVTNNHVVEDADRVTVQLGDDRTFEAEVIGTDPQTDIAVLRIHADDALPFVEFGNSDEIRVGEDVVAVGNPFGLGGTVTTGIVSAKGRNIGAGPYAEFLQTDASINKGNSGGPLFDMDGDVIGVNSAIYSPNGGSVGIGFAVAANSVEHVIDDLLDDGKVDRGWLGVTIQSVNPDIADALGLDQARGALVASVVPDGPSADVLEPGDVILSFDGQDVEDSAALPRLVGSAKIGETSDIEVLRNGRQKTLHVNLGTLDTTKVASLESGAAPKTSDNEVLGATVADLTDTARSEMNLDPETDGVVITSIRPGGAADRDGLEVGDVIVRVGSTDVSTATDLKKALKQAHSDRALVLINRHGQQLFVAVDLA
ncbi:MAG: DegQ family serine endoprotease [Marinibacterium sp.]